MKYQRIIPPGLKSFTLLEILIVLALTGMLLALASMGFNQVARASSLTSTVQQAGDLIVLARQTAVARNLPVEVRFYKLPDYDEPGEVASLWRAMSVMIRDGDDEQPVAAPFFFEKRVIIAERASISPLLTQLGEEQVPSRPFGGYAVSAVRFKSFMVRPDGTLSTPEEVASNSWFFTLYQDTESLEDRDLPANFATLQINPVTARVTILRP